MPKRVGWGNPLIVNDLSRNSTYAEGTGKALFCQKVATNKDRRPKGRIRRDHNYPFQDLTLPGELHFLPAAGDNSQTLHRVEDNAIF